MKKDMEDVFVIIKEEAEKEEKSSIFGKLYFASNLIPHAGWEY